MRNSSRYTNRRNENDTFMNYIWRKINKRPIKHSNVTYINRIPLVLP